MSVLKYVYDSLVDDRLAAFKAGSIFHIGSVNSAEVTEKSNHQTNTARSPECNKKTERI